jgi:hypothetical protein
MRMNIKELIPNASYIDTIVCENLFLKRWGDKLAVVSDADTPKAQSNETYRNKTKLGKARFHWDSGARVWWIEPENLQRAQEILHDVNNTPLEKFIQKVEELPEMVSEPSKRDELTDKVDGFITDLSDSVNEEAMNKKVRDYLQFNAKFRKYSWHNTLLIWIQKPNATQVATYNQWREVHHRQVRKGATGITLLRPVTVGGKKEPEKPATPGTSTTEPSPITPNPEDLAGVKKTGGYTRFVGYTAFDISDTDPIDERGEIPEEPVWHGSNEPHEMADEIYSCAAEVARKMGITITQDVSSRGEQGWAGGGHINITSTVEGVNKAATVIHEIAHELLHFRKTSPLYVGDDKIMGIASKEVKELQAESVSYVVIGYYELPAEHQATYLALWKGSKDRVIENLDTIKRAAQFIIDKIDAEQDRRNAVAAAPEQTPTTERLFECIGDNRFKLTDS